MQLQFFLKMIENRNQKILIVDEAYETQCMACTVEDFFDTYGERKLIESLVISFRLYVNDTICIKVQN